MVLDAALWLWWMDGDLGQYIHRLGGVWNT
jgi:hypothetical protein